MGSGRKVYGGAAYPVYDISNEVGNSLSEMTPGQTYFAVTTDSDVILAANPARKYLLLVNNSDANVFLRFASGDATLNDIMLPANGGNFEMSGRYGNLFRGDIKAIHGGTGSKIVSILEGT